MEVVHRVTGTLARCVLDRLGASRMATSPMIGWLVLLGHSEASKDAEITVTCARIRHDERHVEERPGCPQRPGAGESRAREQADDQDDRAVQDSGGKRL